MDRKSALSKYIKGNITSSGLGIPDIIAEDLNINLKNFFLYSSRELVQRCISANIEEGELQTSLAVKQLATYRLAKLLDIDNLVVKSEFVKLITDHGEKFGALTDRAIGIGIEQIDKTNLTVSSEFQKNLVELQILDTITNEQDHNPGNCFFKIENNRLIGVVAFDNEGCFGLNTDLHRGLCWNVTSPLLTSENKINLPHIGKSLAEKILSIEDSEVKNLLEDLLSEDQINSCVERLSVIKKALSDTISNSDAFLLEDENWSNDTILQEVSGTYGNTYLTHFLKKMGIKIQQ